MLQYVRSGKFHCFLCKKNYTRQSKFEEHVDKDHPFYTSLSFQTGKLVTKDKLAIMNEVTSYCNMITTINIDMNIDDAVSRYLQWNPNEKTDKEVIFVWASDMLSPTTYVQNTKPDRLGNYYESSDSDLKSHIEPLTDPNLINMVKNHLHFIVSINPLLPKILQCDNFEIIIDEFEHFLKMGKPWRGDNFCPSLLIDFIWHCTMMNHQLYVKICRLFFSGTLLSHCLPENEGNQIRYINFCKIFKGMYHRDPLLIENLHNVEHNSVEVYKSKLELQIILEQQQIEAQLERTRIRKIEDEMERQKNIEERRIASIRYDEQRQKEFEKIQEMIRNGTYVEPTYSRESSKC
jgi:hypothetical protein